MTARHFPDGSGWQVEPLTDCASIVSRTIDGVTVWGQVIARREDHAGQVSDLLALMTEDSQPFHRWWDPTTGVA